MVRSPLTFVKFVARGWSSYLLFLQSVQMCNQISSDLLWGSVYVLDGSGYKSETETLNVVRTKSNQNVK